MLSLVGKRKGYNADSEMFQTKCGEIGPYSCDFMYLGQLWLPKGLISVFTIFETSIYFSPFFLKIIYRPESTVAIGY